MAVEDDLYHGRDPECTTFDLVEVNLAKYTVPGDDPDPFAMFDPFRAPSHVFEIPPDWVRGWELWHLNNKPRVFGERIGWLGERNDGRYEWQMCPGIGGPLARGTAPTRLQAFDDMRQAIGA
jgi:hypothetical protein